MPEAGRLDKTQSRHSLAESLGEAVRLCPSVSEALLADRHGMLVASHRVNVDVTSDEMEQVAAEAVAAMPGLDRAGVGGRVGLIDEWSVIGTKATIVCRPVAGGELFLVLRIPTDEFVGRARFAARVAGALIDDAL